MLRALFIMLPLCIAASAVAAESWRDAFESKTYENAAGRKISYRLLSPENIDPANRYPLVLFLHGVGERGSDNNKQLNHGVHAFTKPENRRKYPCFVVAPQCPSMDFWADITWSLSSRPLAKQQSASLKLAVELFETLASQLPVDKNRYYITGISMGGFGAWDVISRRPDYFAAAMPVCGGGDSRQAPKLKDLPLWTFHGGADVIVPTARSKDMIEAIRKAGGAPKITIYPGVGHICWNRVFDDPAALAWLFEQNKK